MNIFQELISEGNYRPIFETLRRKSKQEPYRLYSKPMSQSISLQWLLGAESDVVRELIRAVRRREYFPGEASLHEVQLDKKRKLYSMSWPDRVMDAVLAQLLARLFEPHLSLALFSYRRGLNNYKAVKRCAEYIQRHYAAGVSLWAAKRDVSEYTDHVSTALLLEKMRPVVGEQEPYIWDLIGAFLRPRFHGSAEGKSMRLELGLPSGCAVTPVCGNWYLAGVDAVFESVPEAYYGRYADDILLMHPCRARLQELSIQLEQMIKDLGLEFKADKLQDLFLGKRLPDNAAGFCALPSFDYIGFNLNSAGEISISRKKLRALQADLRRSARRAFLAARRSGFARGEIVDAVVGSLNVFFRETLQHPYIGLMLAGITNVAELKQIDKWIAKLALRYVYGTGHDRVFRHESYRQVRSRGLDSLMHLRNLALRRYARRAA